MENQRKKSKIIVLALILIALCIITCSVAGIYAKYVTSDQKNPSATVAKFGVTITANGGFSTTYKTDDQNAAGTITQSVVSGNMVLAPGTEGNMISIAITGTPEVAVAIKFEADFKVSNWEDKNGAYYCPIELTIGEKTIKGNDFESNVEFEEAVKKAIGECSANYEAGKNLAGDDVKKPSVSWKWAFMGNDDSKDTDLGNNACFGKTPIISLYVTTTVTQID